MGRVHDIDSGYYDPPDEEQIPLDGYYDATPEQEQAMKDPAIFDVPTPEERDQMLEMDWRDSIDAGICPLCGGDCSAANPPVIFCPMQQKLR